MQRVSGYAQQGNVTVNVAGVSSTNVVEGSYPGCTVSIFNQGTLVLASIFSDNGITVKSNPFTASSTDGSFFFYAASGRYDIQFSGLGITTPFTIGDVLLYDPASAPATTINGNLTVTGIVSAANISFSTPMDFGAKADVKQLNDVAITAGSKIVTSLSNPFTAGDVGKFMVIAGAGTSAARALVSPIASFQTTGQVTLTDAAGTTVSPATAPSLAYYGTNDRNAINSCAQTAFAVGGNCWINDNKTFMVSGTGTTISFGALPGIKGGILSGSGTIVYAPYGTLTTGVNDRLFYFSSVRSTPCQIVAGAIAKGATSFVVSSAACITGWQKGDTIYIHEKDSGIGDIVFVDVAMVSSIAGTTVNLINPLSVAFPNTRAFNNSGVPAPCVPSIPCGLSAEKVTNIIQDMLIKDFSLVIPNVTDGTNSAGGIVTTATKRTLIRNITCQNAGNNCFATLLDVALSVTGNAVTCASQNEFAALIAPNITSNQFNTETIYGPLFNYTPVSLGGLNVDLGTGFASVTGNTFGSAASGTCFNAFFGVHDSVFSGNACTFGTTATPAVNFVGTYNNVLTGTVLGGGVGGSTGIQFADTTTANVQINSDKNQAGLNKVDGTFTTPYVVSGANNTDVVLDTSQVTGDGLTLFQFGTKWTLGGTQATNFLVADNLLRGMMLHNSLTEMNLTTGWGYCIGAGSVASGGDTCMSRQGSDVMQFGNAPGNAGATLRAATYQLSGTVQNIGGTSTMGVTLKKGTGSGNYTTASTTYVVVDSTNLCFTVTIPTGWKLGITANGAIGTATGAVAASLALTDNASCATANAGILVETTETTTAAGVLQPVGLGWVINGDGASHNVALQYKTSNGADSATILNSSATSLPTMNFTLMPSN